MRKRVIPLLLAAALVLALCPAALAASGTVPEAEAVQVVRALGIMSGDQNGDLHLDRTVTREELAAMAVKASPYADQVGSASTSPFPDVPRTRWSAGYVQLAVAQGYVSGYLDGTFRPEQAVTLAEAASVVLKLLGYSAADFSGAYPSGQMAMLHSLKLDTDQSSKQAEAALTRRDAMYLFYRMLTARTKMGSVYLNTLGYATTASGEIDRVALINSTMEGPITAAEGWQSQIPFALEGATVYRSGAVSTVGAIRPYDVLYWSEPMRTLWVYGDRAAGTIQALTPSAASPTAVTVAGRTYAIETASAAYDLSSLGVWRIGDTVTLLLGRNGGVAAVAGIAAADTAETLVGVVTRLSTNTYSTASGGTYTADSVTILATDGLEYSYQAASGHGLAVGDPARVTVKDGEVTLNKARSGRLSGKVSTDGTSIGTYALAADVEILDSYGAEGAVRVYPSRLAGMSLTASQVICWSQNSVGEIDRLILDKATGDGYSYGVLTEIQDNSFGMTINVIYQMDLSGRTVPVQSKVIYPIRTGPVQLQGPLTAPDRIAALTSVRVEHLTAAAAYADGQSYALWDGVTVYELRGGTYYLSSLERVLEGGFRLTAWYDKTDTQGGRVRVIVAEPV